ncbi:kinetochore protein SPC25 homolog [Nymphaea colorata]|nr:kinetochore protein SPC25 homolog [Nymphaea colorata]XP_049933465.1 kinetochore protein SPC25 homolog [Nymphaea colorata]
MQRKMREMRLNVLRQIRSQEQKIAAANDLVSRSLDPNKRTVEITVQRHVELGKLREQLRELEDELATCTAANNANIEKQRRTTKSISTTRARYEELKNVVEEQKSKNEEYEAILSKELEALKALEEKNNEIQTYRKGQEEVITWYKTVLGIRIVTCNGIKFIFTNIDAEAPDKEFSFTIKYSQGAYTLMDSNPYVEDTENLIHELNQTNGLFKFVRLMREKFQAAALSGNVCEPASVPQESVSVTSLAPASSFSFSMEDNSGPLLQQSEHTSSFFRLNDEVEKKNLLVVSKLATPLSNSKSPSTARRSSRLQERVHYR